MQAGNAGPMKHVWKIATATVLLLVIYAHRINLRAEPAAPGAAKQGRSVRLFVIGNSFSQNATAYLPRLAKAGGHQITIGRAELGAHSLQQHWSYVEANEANPVDPKGKPYSGKSLRELLSAGTWDVVVLQQYSAHSADIETYRPYAKKFYDFIKKLQPQAEIVWHQTWAYRNDAREFGFTSVAANQRAQTQKEMWEKSRAAYWTMADELGMRVIPVGDAFWKISSNPKWAYKKDPNYNFENPVYPALPDQTYTLNTGYFWDGDNKRGFKLGLDANHANDTGCYLAAVVWYAFLIGEVPEKTAVPAPGRDEDLAAHMRQVAWETVQEYYGK